MSKFKVGDRVRTIDGAWFIDIGTVRGYDPEDENSVAVESDSVKGHTCEGIVPSGLGWWVEEDDLQIVQSGASDAPGREFRVGDRVEVIGGFGLAPGTVGIITRDDRDAIPFLVETVDDFGFFNAEHLSLVEDRPDSPPNPLADLLSSAAVTPSGGLSFNLTINLPPGSIAELFSALR